MASTLRDIKAKTLIIAYHGWVKRGHDQPKLGKEGQGSLWQVILGVHIKIS